MTFIKTKRFDTRNFEVFQNLHPIAYLERAKDGLSIQVLKDDRSGDVILQKDNDFYKLTNQDLSCIETIYCFFNVEPEDVLLSSCISEKMKRNYKPTQILTWNWNKIHTNFDTVKLQFLHYN
jgi:hypothetical protein